MIALVCQNSPSGQRLQQQLNMVAVEFFNKLEHLRVDNEKETRYLSGILYFYSGDFVTSGETADLIAYTNQFRNEVIPLHDHIEFIGYDWTVESTISSYCHGIDLRAVFRYKGCGAHFCFVSFK